MDIWILCAAATGAAMATASRVKLAKSECSERRSRSKRKKKCPTDLGWAPDSVPICSERSESKFLTHLLFSLRFG